MSEHKKMYKAGKRWLVATLTVASVAVGTAVVNGQPAVHAATVDNVTQAQQAADTDPRITVVSEDQNQSQRNQYQQQAQDLQQQVADRNASLEQVNGKLSQYEQEQAAADTAINNDQAQLDQGKQLMDKAVQAKNARRTELLQQNDQLLAEQDAQSKKTKELNAQVQKLYAEYQELWHQYESASGEKLKQAYDKMEAASDAYYAAGKQQVDSINRGTTLGNEINDRLHQLYLLKEDPNPYLPADKEDYERGQQLVTDFTRQLNSDQQRKSSLANRIRSVQRQLQLIKSHRIRPRQHSIRSTVS